MLLNSFSERVVLEKLKELPFFIDMKYGFHKSNKNLLSLPIIYKISYINHIVFIYINYDKYDIDLEYINSSLMDSFNKLERYFRGTLNSNFITEQFYNRIFFESNSDYLENSTFSPLLEQEKLNVSFEPSNFDIILNKLVDTYYKTLSND